MKVFCTVCPVVLEKNEMVVACSRFGGEERCVQDFGGETSGKVTTLKTQA
jgi:hypothetical protein